jgi:hypothetical protein
LLIASPITAAGTSAKQEEQTRWILENDENSVTYYLTTMIFWRWSIVGVEENHS